jgi:glutamyl-tRNA reductase
MPILALGINHKTAPVDIREKVSFSPDVINAALQDLLAYPSVEEAAILSTCNRMEIYCQTNSGDGNVVVDWLGDYHDLDVEKINPFTYIHPDQEAVRHVLRVASGLDSMILGEPQILGQMKDAFASANEAGTIGKTLGRLFQHTFSVAKQVRTDTAIGSSPVSVAFAAVSLSKQIFSEFENHTALLIGAGETIELVARHLKEINIGRIIIANRTVERAHVLADEVGGYAIALGDMPKHLAEADIVISSTASPLPILGKGAVESAIKTRKRQPMLMVDIAVPRDIEKEVGSLEDVYLYTVDDLQEIIQEGLKSRQEAAKQAEEIIDTQVTHFMGWVRAQNSVPLIRAFRENSIDLRDQELDKAMKRLLAGGDPEEILQQLAHNLTNKLIHMPSSQMRQASHDGRLDLLRVAQELYGIKGIDF